MVGFNSKHAFWQALVFTAIVFIIGLIFGFFLDARRADKIQIDLIESEINLLDEQLRTQTIESFNVSCDTATKSLINFADKIYEGAVKLEKYEEASKFGETMFFLHRKYDLLRTFLWLESIELKKRCGGNFNTLVYLYLYDTEDLEISAQQLFYSRLLFDLKSSYPEDVILIPIAVNTDLISVELIAESYNIKEFPVIIVNEKRIISDIVTLEALKNIVFETNII